MRDGIVTVSDFHLARAEQRPSVSHALEAAVADLARTREPLTLGRAADVLDAFMPGLARCGIAGAQASGDFRRMCPLIQDLVVVGSAPQPADAIEALANAPFVSGVLHRTERRIVVLYQGYEIDVRVVTRDELGTVLFATTGPAAHVAQVLRRRTLRLAEQEADVYTQTGLPCVAPELRDLTDAFEVAAEGPLVQLEDIRGDFHMHTTYSDGRDTVHEMIAACAALGYEYIAITDHSENAGASRTIGVAEIEQQADEIAHCRERFPRLAILHGLEVDILPNGRLDCPDDALAKLDVVIASLHERAGHDRAQLTARCLGAIRHPLVSIVSHPSNQLVGRRPGYDMDYDALYAAAAETGTALEIDGAPSHLDLDGPHARAAVEAGVTVTIDSDCHRAAWLARQMRFGVGTARRGAVRPRHVLNTRPLAEVRAFFARKRARA